MDVKLTHQVTLKVGEKLGNEFNQLPEEIKVIWRKKARLHMAQLCQAQFHLDVDMYGLKEDDE